MVIIHISKISIDTREQIVGTHYKTVIAAVKSVFDLKIGCKCYVPSNMGGVFSVNVKSIMAGVITLTGKMEGERLGYEIDLHSPVMDDSEFKALYHSLKSNVLTKTQRAALYVGEVQGYMNIQSYTQYGMSKDGYARAKRLALY
ncbi:MAG: hypothetical protein ACI87J_002250 [Colwellia sp.]|jgi:hypothetical protein